MAVATIWKGVIEFGDVQVPVRFHSAIKENAVHFHLLHEKDKVRVKQVMVNAETGEPVPSDQVRRGFEIDEDRYVILNDKEMEDLQPPESRTIQIECFVPTQQINHQWYERAYYLGVDGQSTDYAALAAALSDNKLEGIARWTMRKRSYLGSLQAHQGSLLMVALRYADEVIPASSLPKPEGRALARNELLLAEQLIAALHTEFDPAEYHDEYRERVMAFIDAKAKGRTPHLRLVKGPKSTEEDNLEKVLKASMKSLKKGRRIA